MDLQTFDNAVEAGVPTCGAVIQKQGDKEVVCGKPAETLYSIADEDGVRVQAVVLMCGSCTRILESGTMMIFVAEDGSRFSVQIPGVNNNDADESKQPQT